MAWPAHQRGTAGGLSRPPAPQHLPTAAPHPCPLPGSLDCEPLDLGTPHSRVPGLARPRGCVTKATGVLRRRKSPQIRGGGRLPPPPRNSQPGTLGSASTGGTSPQITGLAGWAAGVPECGPRSLCGAVAPAQAPSTQDGSCSRPGASPPPPGRRTSGPSRRARWKGRKGASPGKAACSSRSQEETLGRSPVPQGEGRAEVGVGAVRAGGPNSSGLSSEAQEMKEATVMQTSFI